MRPRASFLDPFADLTIPRELVRLRTLHPPDGRSNFTNGERPACSLDREITVTMPRITMGLPLDGVRVCNWRGV